MKKISLKTFKIKSFVTEPDRKKLNTLRGGTYDYDYNYDCGGSDSCYPIYTDKCPTVECTRPATRCAC
ncbi:MAG: pinensin family lanthipeptide [Cyclobacteriaceae bacterium]